MSSERIPAVAGLFYPASAGELERDVVAHLARAAPSDAAPKALILPHAGLVYSGPVAATGYRCLESRHASVTRVVLIGPAHRALYPGIATSGATAFATPLGVVPVDRAAVRAAESLPGVLRHDAAHAPEHCLEVHLPFLQVLLDAFSIVPLLVGDASATAVAEVLEALWGGDETLVVVSSDLSHYHDYGTARVLDRETAEAIEALDPAPLHGRRACGHLPIQGLLRVARRRGLTITPAGSEELGRHGGTARQGGRLRRVGARDRARGQVIFTAFRHTAQDGATRRRLPSGYSAASAAS